MTEDDSAVGFLSHPAPLLGHLVDFAVVVLVSLVAAHEGVDNKDVNLLIEQGRDESLVNWAPQLQTVSRSGGCAK